MLPGESGTGVPLLWESVPAVVAAQVRLCCYHARGVHVTAWVVHLGLVLEFQRAVRVGFG